MAFDINAFLKENKAGVAEEEPQLITSEAEPAKQTAFDINAFLQENAVSPTSARGVKETKPSGTSFGEEVSQLGSAFVESIGRPLENMGESFESFGFSGVANALKGAITEPENYVSAGQRFMEPAPDEAQLMGFAWQYAPRAAVEQVGQAIGAIGTRAVGAAAGGVVAGPPGAIAGGFLGPAAFGAAQVIGPVAKERAMNNGREVPNNSDLVAATLTAIGSGSLDAIGARYLPGGKEATGKFFKKVASAFAGEGLLTEAPQSVIEQIGATAGTEKGLNINVKQAVGEGLIGGTSAAGLTAIVSPFSKPVENQVIRTPEEAEELDINAKANQEAVLLMGDPADQTQNERVTKLKEIESVIANNETLMTGLEPNAPERSKLDLENRVAKKEAEKLKAEITQGAGLSEPITEAEKQQIELAKAITTPAPKPLPTDVLPTETPGATYGREEQVYDVFGGITRKPVSIPKPAELPAAPTIEEQTAEKTYGGETGVFDVFAGARRKPVVTEEPPVSMAGKKVIPGVTPVPVASTQPKATKEAIASATNAANQIEEENRVLEKLTKFNPPSAPTLQDARSLPDAVAKKGRTLSISGGKQEKNILDPKESKKRFDDIGYERQALELPEDMNDRVSGRYGSAIANIKSLYSFDWLGAHFHGGVAVNPEVKGTQRGRIVAHELGHASHSLLGDQINKDQNVLNELQAIEELLYPGLRAKVSAASNPDASFFNYLLSPNELIAEFNVERISNPERAAQVAPALSALLESAEKMKGLVADRKTFPTIMGVIKESKERLKVKDLESRKIKETTNDELKNKQLSDTGKFVISRAKQGELDWAKIGLRNLKRGKAPKSFVKRTAELTGNQELIDYVEELYPESAPTPAVSETITPAAEPAGKAEDKRYNPLGYDIADVVEDVKAGKTDTPLRAINQVVEQASQLRDRVKAESERRQQPRKRGKAAILERVARERSAGNITEKTAQALTDFVNRIREDAIGDTAISIREKGVSNFDFADNLVTFFLNQDKGNLGREVAVHEFWHGLSRFLPEAEVEQINKDYVRELEAYLKKNPWFLAFVGRYTLTPEQYEAYKFFNPKEAETKLTPILDDRGNIIKYKIKFDKDNYRYIMLDEFIAEKMTDLVLGKQAIPDTFLGKLAKAFREFLALIKTKLGIDPYEKFYQLVTDTNERLTLQRESGVAPPIQIYEPQDYDYSTRREISVSRTKITPRTQEETEAFNKASSNKVMARNPELAVAAVRLNNGEITAGEYADLIDELNPFTIKGAESIPPKSKIDKYIDEGKKDKVNAPIESGKEVEFRIDIPTYNRSTAAGDTVYAVTAHEPVPETSKRVGTPISYVGVAKVINPKMMTRSISGKGEAIDIATGSGKFPLATVKGNYEAITELPADINDPNAWTEVSYNPIRSSYFVDVRSKNAVVGGDEAIMVGSRVFVKNPKMEARPQGLLGEDKRYMAVEPTRERQQIMGEKIGPLKKTPEGIIAETQAKLRERFDPTKVTEQNTTEAFRALGRLTGKDGTAFAQELNDIGRMVDESGAAAEVSMGAALFVNDLFEYAVRLAAQGNKKMLGIMMTNINKLPTGTEGRTGAGQALRAAREMKDTFLTMARAEQDAFISYAAEFVYGPNPTKEQVDSIQIGYDAVEKVQEPTAKEVEEEIAAVGEKTGTDLVGRINDEFTKATEKGQAKRKTEIDELDSEYKKIQEQADKEIEKLAKIQSDTPSFDPTAARQTANDVRAIVANDLKQRPDMGRKAPWKSMLVAKLQEAGVEVAAAKTLADIVWRQHEINNLSRELSSINKAIEKGPISEIVKAIKETPLEEQQNPNWRYEVMRDYLRKAGLSLAQAERIAKLMDISLQKRFTQAKEQAFTDAISKTAPWKAGDVRSKRAFQQVIQAIRAGALDPSRNMASDIAALNGWTGFSADQYKNLLKNDAILADPKSGELQKAEAYKAIQDIISKSKLPIRARDVIGQYYDAQALSGIPTLTVNSFSPIAFTMRNAIVEATSGTIKGDTKAIGRAATAFVDSIKSWANTAAFSFKNNVTVYSNVDYIVNDDNLLRLYRKGVDQFTKSKNAKERADGVKNMMVGMMDYVRRILNALDYGAIAALQNQNISKYAMAVMKNKGMNNKQANEVFAAMMKAKNDFYLQQIAIGTDKNKASILADEFYISSWKKSLEKEGVTEEKIKSAMDAAINDALSSVGRNRQSLDAFKEEATNLKDAGMASSPALWLLESVANAANRSDSQFIKVFSRIIYGFAIVPARVIRETAWFSPYGFVRIMVDAALKNRNIESRYAQSLGSDFQRQQRLNEAIAGTVALFGLMALRASSTDDPEDEDEFKIVFTGNGPQRKDDAQFYDSWYKAGNKPNSMILSFGKTKFTLNMMRGFEAFTWPAMMLGALDDLEIRKKQKQQTKTPAQLEDAAIVAGFVFDAALRRGPYAFTTKSLFGTYGDIGVEGVAKGLTFPAKTLIPVLGTSLASNLSNFLNDPIDRRTLDGAVWSNIPFIGPAVAPKSLNAFGEPSLSTDFASKMFKLGVPIVYDIPTDRESIKLHELVLKQGGGPSIPTRNQLAQRLDRQPTNKEYEMFVREYGTILTTSMKKNYDKLFNAKPEFYSKAVERIGNRARDVAENKVRQAAKKP